MNNEVKMPLMLLSMKSIVSEFKQSILSEVNEMGKKLQNIIFEHFLVLNKPSEIVL